MKYLSILFLALVFVSSCAEDDDDNNDLCAGAQCNYTLAAGETAGTVPAALNGVYTLTSYYAQAGSPFPDGTTGKFTIQDNVLTVEIEGEACITLRNPYQTSPSEAVFVDNCRDNLKYAVSQSVNGGLNEVNLGDLNSTFYCQFKE